MIDGHVHLENGPLSLEYILEFAQAAKEKGLAELQILDHSHRFKEFRPMYEPLMEGLPEQRKWLSNPAKKFRDSLDDYIALIEKARAAEMPVKVRFGLEVCYTPESEAFLKELLPKYRFDFLVGAVHSVAGICYDMPYSEKYLWNACDTEEIYRRYLDSLLSCVTSGLFTQLAHPDTVKLANRYPAEFPEAKWQEIAREMRRRSMKAEYNTGLKYRYHHEDLGLSDRLVEIFLKEGVELITASDAHQPADVARFIPEACARIETVRSKMENKYTCSLCGETFTGKFCPNCGTPSAPVAAPSKPAPSQSAPTPPSIGFPGFNLTGSGFVSAPDGGALPPINIMTPGKHPARKAVQPGFVPSDQGLKLLADVCRKTVATVGGDGYSELVLYVDEATDTYTVHEYIDYVCMEYPVHNAYRVDKAFADRVMDTVRAQKLASFVDVQGFPLGGGDLVCRFLWEGKLQRVSLANMVAGSAPLYAVQAVLGEAVREENKIRE